MNYMYYNMHKGWDTECFMRDTLALFNDRIEFRVSYRTFAGGNLSIVAVEYDAACVTGEFPLSGGPFNPQDLDEVDWGGRQWQRKIM